MRDSLNANLDNVSNSSYNAYQIIHKIVYFVKCNMVQVLYGIAGLTEDLDKVSNRSYITCELKHTIVYTVKYNACDDVSQ